MPNVMTEEDRERLGGCEVVASISGGKDSACLSLLLTEWGIDHKRVFADTGWEHPATVEYVKGPLAEKLGHIHHVRGGLQMGDLCLKKGTFPSRLRRFCTEELKVKPIADFLARCDDPVNVVGIRADESKARALLPRWETWDAGDCDVWRPMLGWTEEMVIEMHKRHDLVPNPLYLQGARRVGCWPCIFARKEEIRMVAELTPERIDTMRDLETRVTELAQAKRDEPLKYPRAFFTEKGRRMIPVPIDRAVEWSRTSRGGRQLLLLETEPPGCVRWGMCEGYKP